MVTYDSLFLFGSLITAIIALVINIPFIMAQEKIKLLGSLSVIIIAMCRSFVNSFRSKICLK